MPRTTSTSPLFSRYGEALLKAHENHVNDPLDMGFVELPAGINNGVAKLVDCRFGQYKDGPNKDEWFFIALASIVEPKEFNGVQIEGLYTQIMEPVCNTPGRSRETVDDHIKEIYNMMGLLGLDKASIDPANLEAAAQTLKEMDPPIYTRFRTWSIPKRDPSDPRYNPRFDGPDAPPPRVNHDWQGAVNYTPTGGPADQVEDANTPANGHATTTAPGRPATPRNGSQATQQPAARTQAPAARQATPAARPAQAAPAARPAPAARQPAPPPQQPAFRPAAQKPQAAPSPPPADDYRDDGDIPSLVARAAAEDVEAKGLLTQFAVAAGYTIDEIESVDGWQDVADMIDNPKDGAAAVADTTGDESSPSADGQEDYDENVGQGSEDEWVPDTGVIYGYRPKGPGGKPGKQVEVEVVKIDTAARTCDLKNQANGKVIKGVSFNALETPEG